MINTTIKYNDKYNEISEINTTIRDININVKNNNASFLFNFNKM